MKEQVIKLDKTKAYDLSKLNDNQIRKVAEFVFDNKHESQKWTSFENVIKWFNQYKSSHVFRYAECIVDNFQGFCFISTLKNTIDLTDAQNLFNNEVWKPKQGDKVLVSNDNKIWHERVFVLEYKTLHYCELPSLHEHLIQWKYIKPYKEKIKVSDWVKYNNQVFKVNGKELSSFLLECTKITNPQLIELLEKAINE